MQLTALDERFMDDQVFACSKLQNLIRVQDLSFFGETNFLKKGINEHYTN